MASRSLAAAAAAAVALLLGVPGCGGHGASPSDQADQAVRTFLAAAAHEQWQVACGALTKGQQAALVAQAKQGLLTQNASDCTSALADATSSSPLPAATLRQQADRELSSLRITATHVTGARATVAFSLVDVSSNQRRSASVDLVKQDGRWKIASGAA